MSTSDQRSQQRVAIVLRIKLRYQDVGTFIDKFAVNLSRGGMFIASRSPKPVGSEIRFELLLADARTVIEGIGSVRWVREFDPEHPRALHGMGIEFTTLSDDSRAVIEQVVEHRRSLGLTDDVGIPRARQRPAAKAGPAPEAPAPPRQEPPAREEPPSRDAPAGDSGDAGARADVSPDELESFLARADVELTRARALAQAALGTEAAGLDELDELLRVSATPAAESVDTASAELAALLGGQAIKRRGRASSPPPIPPSPEPAADESSGDSIDIDMDLD